MSDRETYELMEKLRYVEALVHRYQAYTMREVGPQGNPHRGQGRVLALLKLQSPISQKELGYLMDMRQQSLSELLAKLEQKGHITRQPSEEDRRTTIVALTEEGRAAAEQTEEGGMGHLFSCLSAEEQQQFANTLDRVAEALEEKMEAAGVDWKRHGHGPGAGFGPCGHPHHHGPGHGPHGGEGCGGHHGGQGKRHGGGHHGRCGGRGPHAGGPAPFGEEPTAQQEPETE